MGRGFCAFLFWLKVLFACLLAFTVLAFFSLRVYTLHEDGVKEAKQNGAQLGRIVDSPTSAKCQPNSALQRLEPADGSGIMSGFSLDWSYDTPTTIRNKLGWRPAVYNAFIQLDPTLAKPYDTTMVAWHAQQVQLSGGILELTIEATPMQSVTDAICEMVAQQLHDINFNMGVPVLFRYGHEMNGDWTSYGYKPIMYVAAFRKMATAVRAKTNMTAMLWSPNVGIAYPFTASADSQSPPPKNLTADPVNFPALDTNNDGVLDFQDDPYGPYYPGDDYVDWVGLSLYYYQDNSAVNVIPPATFLQDYMTGSGPSTANVAGVAPYNATARDFYTRFAVNNKKPMILAESGAPWLVQGTGASELAIKQAWWTQTITAATASKFPKLKAIVNFEERKTETTLHDWQLANDTTTRQPYSTYMTTTARSATIFANQLNFACSGTTSVTAASAASA